MRPCFPLDWYEEIGTNGGQGMFPGLAGEGRYIRHDGVSDFIQREFEKVLGTGIPKEDIFHWVYGALHSPRYRAAFEADLKKQLPRLPLPEDRPAYERVLRIGRELARLHLHYEEVEPWPLAEVVTPGTRTSWRVEKLCFGKKGKEEDRSVIVVNPTLRLEGIPEEGYGYVVNGRSAIVWIMDRYQVRRDAESGIVNDPNQWGEEHGNPRYIVELIGRVVRVSMESVRLIAQIDGEAASACAGGPDSAPSVRVLSGEEVAEALRFVRFLPLYSLKAACGRFGDGEAVEPEGWVEVEGARPDRRMFAVRAAGRSMEPLIRDGDFCVMRAGVEGSREGRIVLAQHRGVADPESGGAYSIKRYRSEKRATSDGSWRHERIVLEPLNRDFDAIEIGEEDADGVRIVAERVEGVRVVGGG
ncbi:MAG: hypothetical protein IKQ55_08540 [Kiritimatiellae bacterium]|nr:hypothetical protein [Kiritimatiellia bacterium]